MEVILYLNKNKWNLQCVLLRNFCDISTSSPVRHQLHFWTEMRCHAAKKQEAHFKYSGLPLVFTSSVFFPMKIHAKLEFSDFFFGIFSLYYLNILTI